MPTRSALFAAVVLLLVSPTMFVAQQLNAAGLIPMTATSLSTKTGGPLSTAATVSQDACHENTCPDPKSCGSWSGYYSCEDPFCEDDPSCYYSDFATYQFMNRFRACVLQDNSSCIEYQIIANRLYCGC
jgi:hypothetical protein